METNDREPKYLGTHRGVARVQIGWTTLYFRGDAYTHALGSLYGTQESPTREEITAARKVIPVVPRPPVMANAPAGEREPSRKPGTSAKKNAKAEPPAKKGAGDVPAPAASAKTPKRKKASVPTEKKPAPPRKAPPPKSAARRAKAPIATMAELEASIVAPARRDNEAIGSMAELEAQIG